MSASRRALDTGRCEARKTLDAIDRVLHYDPHPCRSSDPVRALCDRARNIAQALHLHLVCAHEYDDPAEGSPCANGIGVLPLASHSLQPAGRAREPGGVTSHDGTVCDCYDANGCTPDADAAGSRIGAVLTLTSALVITIIVAALVGLL